MLKRRNCSDCSNLKENLEEMLNLQLNWEPYWYDLDQTIIVGDKDFFYLNKEKTGFANGFATSEDKEVIAEVIKIRHQELGELKGLLAIGLSYKFYFSDGDFIQVDSEQEPGNIEFSSSLILAPSTWSFIVELEVLEETGFSSQSRLESTQKPERNKIRIEREEKYKRLLNIDF
jgi:hypothetical protein